MERRSLAKMVCIIFVFWAAAVVASPAQTFTTLVNFDFTNGEFPLGMDLVQATDGNLYGTVQAGGAHGVGTVFKMTTAGVLTTIYNFCSEGTCTDGEAPFAGLVQATNGDFYGTTDAGGAYGGGTVFEITPDGTMTTLHSFCVPAACADGAGPWAGLVQATNGNFYGTTGRGGANLDGTVFEITPAGALTTLYSFCALALCADGLGPVSGLVQATNGGLYGTTQEGGTSEYPNGTVFEVTPTGALTTLYSFCAQTHCTDGAFPYPYAALVQANNGDLYGTTLDGGASGAGTIFKITPAGTLTTVYSFCVLANCADGAAPYTGLVQGSDGNLYGTTYGGGIGYGTVFKISPGGTLTTLHSFCAEKNSDGYCTDGSYPQAGLTQDTNGKFYGTAYTGGSSTNCEGDGGCGTLFSLSVGLPAFVETQTTSGKVGAPVKILGTNLTSATSVTFNGTAATFTVVSKSEITTTVPTGATTGTVEVKTSSGTLKSNVKFRVTQTAPSGV